MLDRNPGKSMADLYRDLPKTWGSPTMSPHCADEVKYAVADRVVARLQAMQARGEPLTGQPIRDLVTVNGVRVTVEDGTWGLVRASSNKPELVVVVESPVSERACARCSRRSTGSCARTRKSAPTTRRSEAMDAASRTSCPTCSSPASKSSSAARRREMSRRRAAPITPIRRTASGRRFTLFGLTPRKLRPEEYPELPQWGLGLTDIAKHVSGVDRELPAGRARPRGLRALEARIKAAEPEWLAFTSLNAGRRYLGRAAGFGEQPERIGRTRLWVLPSPRQLRAGTGSATRTGGEGSPTRPGAGSRPPPPQGKRASLFGPQPVKLSANKRQ